jgi:transaldolase
MREEAVSGVTSNPTIFQKAVSAGDAYDDQLRDLVEMENDPKEIFIRLASKDVPDACDLLRSVWDEGGRGCDGYVSSRPRRQVRQARRRLRPRGAACPEAYPSRRYRRRAWLT